MFFIFVMLVLCGFKVKAKTRPFVHRLLIAYGRDTSLTRGRASAGTGARAFCLLGKCFASVSSAYTKYSCLTVLDK